MSNSNRRGLRIGHYRITPLGIGAIAALVVVIAAVIVLCVVKPFGQTDLQQTASSIPTIAPSPTADLNAAEATPTPSATPSVTATPRPTATPEPEPRSATIRVLGEIMMETDLLKSAYNPTDKTFDFSSMFTEIADVVGNADYTIGDVEGTLGDTQGFSGESDKMLTPSAILDSLREAGVDMLMLANDHALDGGVDELQATISNVSDAGLDYVGVGATAEERSTPVIRDINGISVGFVGYCEALNVSGISKDDLVGCINLVTNSNAPADIQSARDAGAEIVIAIVNWGKMYSFTATETQQQIAQVLVNAGADVILGYNPHSVQPALWLESTVEGESRRALCLCAPGNFLSNQRETGHDCGLIFEFTLMEQADGSIAVESPLYIPTYVLRYEDSDGLYRYRTLAIGQWTDDAASNLPEGMQYADLQYMGNLWAAIQNVMGTDVASIARE